VDNRRTAVAGTVGLWTDAVVTASADL